MEGPEWSMRPKLAAVLAQDVSGGQVNVSAVCRELAISRKHYYTLRRRFVDDGVEAIGAGRSRRPKHSPGQLSAAVEDEIVRWRKQLEDSGLDAGAQSIRYELR